MPFEYVEVESMNPMSNEAGREVEEMREREETRRGARKKGAELFKGVRGLAGTTTTTKRRRHLLCDVRRTRRLARRRDQIATKTE
jgi:hypothetical protein